MKLSLFLLLVSMQVTANMYSQNVSLDVRNERLGNVLKVIEHQTGYRFTYSNRVLPAGKPVTLQVREKNVNEVLNLLLQGLGLAYREESGRLIVIFQKPPGELHQLPAPVDTSLTLRGRVTTERGTGSGAESQPLSGVSINVKGTTQGTTTDAAGQYTIQVSKGQVLVFSYVGFDIQELTVRNGGELNVELRSKAEAMNDVVVVGYGTQRKTNLTASVASVNSKDLQNQVTNNVLNAIAGQMPGVEIKASTGRPGANPVIRVRGTGSISADNEPLYVVDGMPLANSDDINMLNPSDIETMDVLKDASAAAIYGSRGGNGVILITTKKGKAGQSKIDFSTYMGWQDIPKKIDVLDRDQHIQFYKEATLANWLSVGGDPNTPNGQRIYNNSKANVNYVPIFDTLSKVPNIDWQNEVFNEGAPMRNYQLSASGGSDRVRYFISGNYYEMDGIVKKTDLKRYSARVNVEATINKYARAGMNISPSYTKENRRWTDNHINSPEADASVILSALVQPPTLQPRLAPGLYGGNLGTPEYIALGYAGATNPLQVLDDPKYHWYQESFRWLGSAYAELEPIKGLVLRTMVGIDSRNYATDKYRPSTVSTAGGPVLVPIFPGNRLANILGVRSEGRQVNATWDNTLTYQKRIADDHDLNVLVGYSAQKWNSASATVSGQTGSFQNDLVESVSGATVLVGSGASKEQWSLLSIMGRINYAYKDKYLFSAVMRRDGSSRFGRSNKWGTFPSVSVGWRLTEEPFMRSVNFISELKVRANYGRTGNFSIGNYTHIPTLGGANYTFGGSGVAAGYSPSRLANDELTWEISTSTDIGLDVSVLKNRISLGFDYYKKITEGLLYNLPIPAVAGFTSIQGNIGKIQNRGIELSLNTINIRNKNFQWSTRINFSRNRNKVLQIGKNNEPINADSEGAAIRQIIQVGHPMAEFFGYQIAGVYIDQKDVDAHPEGRFTQGNRKSGPGDTRFVDVNGDGQLTAADRTIIGDPNPDFTCGIVNRLSYKGFDMEIQLQGVYGNDVYFQMSRFNGTLALSWNPLVDMVENRWRSPEQPGNGLHPRAATLGNPAIGLNESQADRWLYDGSYLRIRNVTLGYNVPANLVKKARLNSVRLYTTVQNLHTFSKYIGYDPDVNVNGSTVVQPGLDYASYPLTRTFTIGLNLAF